MPIPLLFIGIGAAAGAFGIGKSIKAGVDQKEANWANGRADEVIKIGRASCRERVYPVV